MLPPPHQIGLRVSFLFQSVINRQKPHHKKAIPLLRQHDDSIEENDIDFSFEHKLLAYHRLKFPIFKTSNFLDE